MGLIVENINVRKESENKWVLSSPHKNLLVSENVYLLFKQLLHSESFEESYQKFKNHFKQDISYAKYHKLIDDHFKGKGFLTNERTTNKKKSYLTLKIDLIPKRWGEKISYLFEFLFYPKTFKILSTFLLLFIIYICYKYNAHSYNFNATDILVSIIIVNLSIVFHEFGHISAYNYFIKNFKLNSYNTSGQIGFGFYFIFPVFYSNVTQAWSLEKNYRQIINIAGIYFQIIISAILFICFLIFNLNYLLLSSYLVFLYALFELNPFIRSDGYWILSDATNKHNLIQKSKLKLIEFLKTKNGKNFNWLVIYASGNYMLMLIFVLGILLYSGQSFLKFPYVLAKSLYSALLFDFSKIEFDSSMIYYLGIYIIVLTYGYRLIRMIFGNSKRKKLLAINK